MTAKEFIKKWTPSIIFNVGELLAIFLTGLLLLNSINISLYVMLAFILTRMAIGKPKHYKAWQLCLIWSYAVFLSMFVVAKADIIISFLLSAFCALIVSNHANLSNMLQWKPKGESKYQKEIDFVKYNPISTDLISFEDRLKRDNDNLSVMCYEYIFKQGKTWQEAANDLDTETYKLAPIVEKVAFGIRLSCKI